MSTTSAAQNEKTRYHEDEIVVPSASNLLATDEENMEVEEEDEEDEDVDFNPFRRGDSPSEASSSLSSENEGPGDNVERNSMISLNGKDTDASSRLLEQTRGCEDDEIVMQATDHDSDDVSGSTMEKEICSLLRQGDEHGDGLIHGEASKDFYSRSGSNGENYMNRDGTLQQPILQIDHEDAICRRTRARHSLANYKLEELETFLQESDDDGDLPNVDDEEEYRKFLAAVLLEEADDEKEGEGDRNIDEDEDNDADFELEIEEALESDVDERLDFDRRNDSKLEVDAHMPVTRQKKRLKESAKNKKTLLGQAKTPLRHLIPYESTMWASSFPTHGCQFSSHVAIPQYSSAAAGADLIIGFTAQQIGQLYCLIHEHVQLLIQVFSVSILDPSKQEVATGVQKMIVEMNCKREEAFRQRKIPYPEFCFHRPNLQSSILFDFHQSANSSYWAPSIDNCVLSVLDVAPLRLVKSFMTDVSDTVLSYRRIHVEDAYDKSHLIREPLFPLPALESSSNPEKDTSAGTNTMYSHALPAFQVSPVQANSKRSIASMMVENTKKESVALVPKDIAKSAQRFYPLFNAALFPHKPPLPSIANRVLFTDAEDGLLAMGLMQYNNDWAAIQQRFLPCKSTHQIFVRQKNRSSSKAPENPIKAVRRMKTSPLTNDEKTLIYEGLKLFKNDWFSVWKFIVPHRDPSLLPRLWRITTGTQKSYTQSADKKAKRRLYDAKRRKREASMYECQTVSDKEQVDNGGDNSAGDVDVDDEAYVHEAFLADAEHGSLKNMSDRRREIMRGRGRGVQNSPARNFHPHYSQIIHSASSRQRSYDLISRASNIHLVSQPSQTHKSKGFRVVKLAPDLPPVNLPPSVRVISQSAFRSYHSELPASAFSDALVKDDVPRGSQHTRGGSSILKPGEHSQKSSDNGLHASQQQDTSICASQLGAEENTSESDLQMHPLLFQAPENHPSYFSINIHDTGSAIQNSFHRNPPQVDTCSSKPQYSVKSDLFDNATEQPEKAPSDLQTIDFHPLLQRAEGENVDFTSRSSLYQLSGDIRASQDNANKLVDQSDNMLRTPASLTYNDKENNLDLDIRLCSAPHKGKTSDMETHSVLEHRMLGKNRFGNVTFPNFRSRFPDVSTPGNLSLQSVPPAISGGCHSSLDLNDNSVPDIVMEHEELSDSEDEVEHVEFECEEIDDSEDDEKSVDLPSVLQNKEFPVSSPKEGEIQASEALQTRNLMDGSGRKSEKPKRGSAKTNRSCTSPRDMAQALHGSSKRRSSDSAKMHPLQTIQCKDASTSRKPRKRSLMTDLRK